MLESRDFLLIAEAVAPLGEGVAALGAAGLGRALAALGNRTTVLTLASPDVAARVPGLARRLRTVTATVGDRTYDLTLFEGRVALSEAQLLVLAATPSNRAETATLLALKRSMSSPCGLPYAVLPVTVPEQLISIRRRRSPRKLRRVGLLAHCPCVRHLTRRCLRGRAVRISRT